MGNLGRSGQRLSESLFHFDTLTSGGGGLPTGDGDLLGTARPSAQEYIVGLLESSQCGVM